MELGEDLPESPEVLQLPLDLRGPVLAHKGPGRRIEIKRGSIFLISGKKSLIALYLKIEARPLSR